MSKFVIFLLLLFFISPVYAAQTSFEIGLMGSDVIPHQIVRTNNDKVYLFGYTGDYATAIKGYWTQTAGLPQSAANFNGSVQISETEGPISVDLLYDGGNYLHILTNTKAGKIKDYPFDITTNTVKPVITIATDSGKNNTQVGTSGLSGQFDLQGNIHIAYWTASNTILHKVLRYSAVSNSMSTISGPTQISGSESNGMANHPSLAVSPYDGSIMIAWIKGTDGGGDLYARIFSQGQWQGTSKLNSSPVWTSPSAGTNIDQGPSVVIGTDGTIHLAYMQNWESVGSANDYGRVHYVKHTSAGWIDQPLQVFTHDPAIGIDASQALYIIGHGHRFNINSNCTNNTDMCVTKKSGSSWGSTQIFANHPSNGGFDTSPSVKWSAVGFNRPETLEFIFPNTVNGSYEHTTIYYARIDGESVSATTRPTLSLTPSPQQKAGDGNGDNAVNGLDYVLWLNNYSELTTSGAQKGDFNANGKVDGADYIVWLTHFGI